MHETGKSQARFLQHVFDDEIYQLDKSQLDWLAADGASLNTNTVKHLLEHGFSNVQYARCLPHALSRVMVAFMGPFEDAFGLTSMLQTLHAFITAGGQVSRKAALAEYGISKSKLDHTATRWSSLMLCVVNLCSLQSESELHRAAKKLKKKAREGDAGASEALKEPDVPRKRWDVVYEAVESIDVEALAGELACRTVIVAGICTVVLPEPRMLHPRPL
jgi:hypothetical protein